MASPFLRTNITADRKQNHKPRNAARRKPQPKQNQKPNPETQRDGAGTKTKSKTTDPETQRKQRFFGGIAANSAIILAGDEKGWAKRYNPQKPLLPLLPLRFKVLLLKIVLENDAFGD